MFIPEFKIFMLYLNVGRWNKINENIFELMEKQTNLFVIGVSGMRHFKRYLIVND